MLIGHKKQWEFLENKSKSGQLSHAYLLSGPDQVGKKTFALEFIKFLGCKFPDLLLVEKKEDAGEIKIEQAREAQNFLSLRPYYGGYKAVVIDNAEQMNAEAQSCFLKTLEEPKGQTILLLVTSKPETLLATISSRCQQIKFARQKEEEIKAYLKEQGCDAKLAEELSEISEGRLGRAMGLFLNPEKLKKEKQILQELLSVLNADLAEKFKYAKSIDFEKQSLQEILQVLQRYLRQLLLFKTGAGEAPKIKPAKDYTVSQIKDIIKITEDLNAKIMQSNVNEKLALEVLLMDI